MYLDVIGWLTSGSCDAGEQHGRRAVEQDPHPFPRCCFHRQSQLYRRDRYLPGLHCCIPAGLNTSGLACWRFGVVYVSLSPRGSGCLCDRVVTSVCFVPLRRCRRRKPAGAKREGAQVVRERGPSDGGPGPVRAALRPEQQLQKQQDIQSLAAGPLVAPPPERYVTTQPHVYILFNGKYIMVHPVRLNNASTGWRWWSW